MKHSKNIADYRAKSANELVKVVADLKEQLRLTRLDIATGKSKNGAAVAKLKRDIARALTVANEPRA